jgi:hypothetical protein
VVQLISKLQYKNCETGEFFAIFSRSLEETQALITGFPWKQEREMASVYLTCPSVTIEHPSGHILKLGPYYNGKFSLYLLDCTGVVSQKIILSVEDSFALIRDFFNDKDIAGGFTKMSFTWDGKKHFLTNRFEYTVTPKRVIRYLLFPEGVGILYMIILLLSGYRTSFLSAVMVMFIFSTVLYGINTYLLFNYHFFSRNLYLRMSKAHDSFLFGPKDEIKEYAKADIEIVFLYKNKGQRCPWGDYIVYDICLKNGDRLHFPSLLLGRYDLSNKLPGVKFEEIHEAIATC